MIRIHRWCHVGSWHWNPASDFLIILRTNPIIIPTDFSTFLCHLHHSHSLLPHWAAPHSKAQLTGSLRSASTNHSILPSSFFCAFLCFVCWSEQIQMTTDNRLPDSQPIYSDLENWGYLLRDAHNRRWWYSKYGKLSAAIFICCKHIRSMMQSKPPLMDVKGRFCWNEAEINSDEQVFSILINPELWKNHLLSSDFEVTKTYFKFLETKKQIWLPTRHTSKSSIMTHVQLSQRALSF